MAWMPKPNERFVVKERLYKRYLQGAPFVATKVTRLGVVDGLDAEDNERIFDRRDFIFEPVVSDAQQGPQVIADGSERN